MIRGAIEEVFYKSKEDIERRRVLSGEVNMCSLFSAGSSDYYTQAFIAYQVLQ